MAESRSRVAIIGAGIGGLSLGLALQERGIQADVFGTGAGSPRTPCARTTGTRSGSAARTSGIHRADLQKTLGSAFPTERLHLGCRLVDIVQERDSVVLEFANGRVERADLVVGADGARSTVRRFVTGADDAVYSGTSAFRGIVAVENLPSLPDPHAIQFWMGPDAHMLHYAIGGNGESVNFFAVVETPKI